MRWYGHRYHSPLSLRIVFATIPRLPKALHPPIAVITAAIFFLLLPAERRAVMRNLETIQGRRSWRTWAAAFGTFYAFCDLMVSYCYLPSAGPSELLAMLSDEDRGASTIDACLALGRGLVVWTAHVANWEFATRLLELHGRRVNVARAVEPGNPAEAQLRDLMTSDRLRVVDVTEKASIVQLFAALRAGEIVAIQGDRVYGGEGQIVPFFGRPSRFPDGAFQLACRAGAPVVPGLVVRTGWLRYRMIVGEPLLLHAAAPADVAVRQALVAAASFLERHLRRWPSQWLNFFEFWPAADAASAAVAPTTPASPPSESWERPARSQ